MYQECCSYHCSKRSTCYLRQVDHVGWLHREEKVAEMAAVAVVGKAARLTVRRMRAALPLRKEAGQRAESSKSELPAGRLDSTGHASAPDGSQ